MQNAQQAPERFALVRRGCPRGMREGEAGRRLAPKPPAKQKGAYMTDIQTTVKCIVEQLGRSLISQAENIATAFDEHTVSSIGLSATITRDEIIGLPPEWGIAYSVRADKINANDNDTTDK